MTFDQFIDLLARLLAPVVPILATVAGVFTALILISAIADCMVNLVIAPPPARYSSEKPKRKRKQHEQVSSEVQLSACIRDENGDVTPARLIDAPVIVVYADVESDGTLRITDVELTDTREFKHYADD